ncbi:SRPBCC family protein [Streptosporangium sp. NPDC051022]|uniref:SRPBCC family protein n=1 Tax=Streptosporangium sp. NPDC051022 TaxID=3155752 RepID=UPI003444B82B
MKLEQEFTIPVEVGRAWEVLLDVTRVAACFPGASLTSVEDDTLTGSVKVKLGPVLLTYSGVARFEERDAENRRVAIDARGTDTKGNGSASARVTATLHATGEASTTCSIVTDLNVTGRPAQFGRGMMLEIGNKVLGQFSANLAASLAESERQPVTAPVGPAAELAGSVTAAAGTADAARETQAPSAPPRETEALDLLDVARGSLVKRLVPVAVGVVVVAGVVIWWANR